MNPYSIGVGVFIRDPKTSKILVGQRGPKCARGAGCLALPGGKVDPGECIAQTVLREVMDETGLKVALSGVRDYSGTGKPEYITSPFSIPGVLAVTDHLDPQQQKSCPEDMIAHLSLWVMTTYLGGEPVPLEREAGKCDWWQWMSPAEIATWRGVDDPTHAQYYWTPMPLWRKILRPYFGEF
jgi:ADP-ribose pyrophosphatase YjhB (NUDIX family)